MTTQDYRLADIGHQMSPSDQSRPFTNIVPGTRIPEKLVNSGDEKESPFNWRLGTQIPRPIAVAGGFNEIDHAHSPKKGVLYQDDAHQDPNKPAVKFR